MITTNTGINGRNLIFLIETMLFVNMFSLLIFALSIDIFVNVESQPHCKAPSHRTFANICSLRALRYFTSSSPRFILSIGKIENIDYSLIFIMKCLAHFQPKNDKNPAKKNHENKFLFPFDYF
jgi:hypothetical protein